VLQKFLILAFPLVAGIAFAQQSGQPEVKLNVLNVCSPSADEQQQLSSALAKIPKQPAFATDFEVDRGRSTLDASTDLLPAGSNNTVVTGGETASWVRIRHEFPASNAFSSVQYSFSVDPGNMVETLVFRLRDPKDLISIAIEDSASSITTSAAMLAANTPASRIKLERMGKSSVVLARCGAAEGSAAPDQSKYEPLFQAASKALDNYRSLLGVRNLVPSELARMGTHKTPGDKPAPKPATAGSKQ
jgi:hypothetical protein